jgi:hypothetical protein
MRPESAVEGRLPIPLPKWLKVLLFSVFSSHVILPSHPAQRQVPLLPVAITVSDRMYSDIVSPLDSVQGIE